MFDRRADDVATGAQPINRLRLRNATMRTGALYREPKGPLREREISDIEDPRTASTTTYRRSLAIKNGINDNHESIKHLCTNEAKNSKLREKTYS